MRRAVAGLALSGIGVAVACAMLEILVRALHLVPTRFWEPDPLLGSRLVPGKSGWWTQEELEFRVPVTINRHGFRDVDRDLTKPLGTYRVLLLGDSFVEAMQVPLESTVGRQLEAELGRRLAGRRVEVLNMGVSGYGTAGALLLYRERGRRFDPDLVVLSFYPGNDVRNNSPSLEPLLVPEYDAGGALVRVAAKPRRARAEGLPARLLARSKAYTYVRKTVLTRFPGLARRLADAGVVAGDAVPSMPLRDGIPVDYWVYATPVAPEWEDAWRRTERLLEELAAAAHGDGCSLAIVVVDAREQVYPEIWQQILATHPAMQERRWDLTMPEERAISWCRQHAVPCLRLAPAFVAARDREPPLHYRHDGHWTAAGHRVAARATAQFLSTIDDVTGSGQ